MTSTFFHVAIAIVVCAPVCAQKRWTDAAEYEICLRAGREAEPNRQIELLLDWEAAYPTSEFKQERVQMLMAAYQRARRPADAFARAAQLLNLDPMNLAALHTISATAPSLQAASPEQIRITNEAATRLLARAPEIGRAATAVPPVAVDLPAQTASDPQAEGVTTLIREWRRTTRILSSEDVELDIRSVAERALAWVKQNSK